MRTGGKAKMIWIEKTLWYLVELLVLLGKWVVYLIVATLAIFLAIILREVAWTIREESRKRMEEKKKDEDSSI
jgi:hypothetical protein